jgi:hypothetical protein
MKRIIMTRVMKIVIGTEIIITTRMIDQIMIMIMKRMDKIGEDKTEELVEINVDKLIVTMRIKVNN